jgi:uncharacterized protein
LEISASYTVPVPRERAYQLLQDPAILAKCVPGTDRQSALVRSSPPEKFKLMVDGTGKIGFVKGERVLTLEPAGEATDVKYEGEVQVGGTIAGVGQRLLHTTAKLIIKKFFEKFSEAAQA